MTKCHCYKYIVMSSDSGTSTVQGHLYKLKMKCHRARKQQMSLPMGLQFLGWGYKTQLQLLLK